MILLFTFVSPSTSFFGYVHVILCIVFHQPFLPPHHFLLSAYIFIHFNYLFQLPISLALSSILNPNSNSSTPTLQT
ncbi:hypothetical protein Fmac_006613 [Flemingia macrophylla]|uniref:Uncharacterized protein n=1 Tax=Flemingia macrophylla TaxID=520843 RepID=A0ABD1NB40_9FABA